MSKTLTEIAQQIKDANKKVQLIYAFNGIGKTRLSREFKELVTPKANDIEGEGEADQPELPRTKILYYNAFTEDLFYWDNDLDNDTDPKLKIQPNSFTDWVLKEQGQDQNVITTFQRYTNDKLMPRFNTEYKVKDKDDKEVTIKAFSEIIFSLERGDDERSGSLKISKGEESCFVWSIFYALLEQVIDVLNVPEPDKRETNDFDQLKYVFIDDPVSSLDENHLIEVAVNLAELIKKSQSAVKFIVTTHNTLFYNILFNELKIKVCYMLEHLEDGTYALTKKEGDSNTSFSYHLHLIRTIEQAIAEKKVEKYHFILLRNLYEKTASFLGYPKWSDLLPPDKELYLKRILAFASHRSLSNEEVAEPIEQEKKTVGLLLDHLKKNHLFWSQEKQNV